MAGHALADLGRVLLDPLFFPDAWEAQRRFLQYAVGSVRATKQIMAKHQIPEKTCYTERKR